MYELQTGLQGIGGSGNILAGIIVVLVRESPVPRLERPTDRPQIFSTILYRLYFSPLARHPGPILTRLSSIPNYYHARKGDRHEWIHSLHLKYGSVVRFTPDHISFNTPSAVETIYKSRKSNVIKADWYQTVQDSAGGFESTFTTREKGRHGVKRRLLSHAFSEKALKNYEPRICNLIDMWIECLGAEAEKNVRYVDLGEWCNYLIFDILGDLGYGQSFGLTTKKEDRSIVKLVPKATAGWTSLGYHPLTKILRWILFKTRLGPVIGGQSFHDNGRFRDFCLQKLKARRQAWTRDNSTAKRSTDMFEYLLNGRDPETDQSYAVGDLACESVLLMVAGSQSTSGALSATFFYLAHHPSVLMKLRHEIHTTFADPSEIHYIHGNPLGTLPYLRACIDESLRLSPPTPGHLPREIVGKGLVIDGRTYPPGTNVGVSSYAIHRTEVFRDPYAFVPERWLDERHALGTAFHPFSAGATGCPGRQLAIMELSLTVAKLLWKFDLLAVGGNGTRISDVEYRMRDFFVGEGAGPRLQLVLCPP